MISGKKRIPLENWGIFFFIKSERFFFFESDFPAIVYCLMLLPKVCYVAKPSNT